MKILFDNGTPKPNARSLSGHEITFTRLICWPLVKLHLDRIAAAVNVATPGSFVEVDIPFE